MLANVVFLFGWSLRQGEYRLFTNFGASDRMVAAGKTRMATRRQAVALLVCRRSHGSNCHRLV